jgi:glycosyltransferase involved in cell wall biosynthesis
MKPNQPTVSVLVVTYNHESYIRQCLDSILAQKTTFPFEVVIGDDCSTDNTASVLREYHSKYPDKFCLVLHEKNIGPGRNAVSVYDACQGEYLAVCEGDDFWTDENKLQLQWQFLEAHPQMAVCGHKTMVLLNGVYTDYPKRPLTVKKEYTLEEYIERAFFHTSSFFFRASAFIPYMPKWYAAAYAGDLFCILICALHGTIGYIPKAMSVYRANPASVTHLTDLKHAKQRLFTDMEHYDAMTNGQKRGAINKLKRKWEVLTGYDQAYPSKILFLLKNAGPLFRGLGKDYRWTLLPKYLLPRAIVKMFMN